MNPVLCLRIAAVLTLLYAAGHTIGAPWTPAKDPQALALSQQMKSNPFAVLGVLRTYWDFYFGFGVAISVYQFVQAVVLWQLASLARSHAPAVRAIVATFFVAFVANAVICWMYFFAPPLV